MLCILDLKYSKENKFKFTLKQCNSPIHVFWKNQNIIFMLSVCWMTFMSLLTFEFVKIQQTLD